MRILPSETWFGNDAHTLAERRIVSRACSGANASRKRNREKGGSRLKLIIWLVVLGFIINVAVIVVPVYVNEFQFQNNIQEIARFASVNRKTVEDIQRSVLEVADKDSCPVQPSDVKVKSLSGNIRIDVDYSVPVDLRLFQWTINFHPSAVNDALF